MDFIKSLASRSTYESLMLDIGGNVGGYTNMMLEHKGIIHTFEPCPKLAQDMRERFKSEPRVTVFQEGVSDHSYTDDGFTVFEAWTLAKANEPNKRGLSLGALEMVGKEPFTIHFTTIDEHVHGAMRVDFMKVDTDGYDLRVLKGARKTIQAFRPNILIELGYLVEDVGDSNDDLMRLIFLEMFYRVYDIDGAEMPYQNWREWFPNNTTRDYAIVPAERKLMPVT